MDFKHVYLFLVFFWNLLLINLFHTLIMSMRKVYDQNFYGGGEGVVDGEG